jgi:hypothetical protein
MTVHTDRSQFPAADDEYTPEQRQAIDARLREAEKGPFYGPFKDGDEIAAFLKARARAAKPARTRSSALPYLAPAVLPMPQPELWIGLHRRSR